MASTSDRGEYYEISLPDGGCDDNQPLSACYAYDLTNNARHLRDESTQYRVNWVGGDYITGDAQTSSNYIIVVGTATDYQHTASYVFPWQATPGAVGLRTPVLRLVGACETSNTTFFVGAFMTGYMHSIQDYYNDGNLSTNGHAWDWEGNTATETTGNIIAAAGDDKTADPQMAMDAGINGVYTTLTWELDVDGSTVANRVAMYMYRLSVWTKGSGYIHAISLREYSE
jgi:hypothetical protein